MGTKHEIREWLSVAPADVPVWIAGGLAIAMYYVQNVTLDIGMSVLIIGLTLYACVIGMKYDDRVSRFTNIAKKVVYPLYVLLGAAMIYLNFVRWGNVSAF